MAEAIVKFTALVIESEREWGQKIDEIKEFDTERERDDFIRNFNSQNTPGPAPDYYWIAERGKDKVTVVSHD